ncbi:alpha-mannosidase [Chamaesiphon minutus]|uniref:Alpha-mannosidase n=1 Tax=Chamaesiphon minutus (strain ATCC 27169 / PCC 6605) TaxID=1173020 RepID=K9UGT3_CHAP6|nr:alpha-mannosidase [Chamaesiphon minutus]AFY93848.1 alpha-mannosidase [Chamaesiphon minutus PCC 6605]
MNDSEQSFVSSIAILVERLRNLSQQDLMTGWKMFLGAGSVDADPNAWELANLNPKGQIAWERGRREIWLAQQVVMPIDLYGYPVTSLSCRLAFTWWAELAQVFVDGELVQEGDLFDHSPRVLLMSAVVPGTAVDVRLRLISPGHDIGALMRSRLIFESVEPTNPEPGWLADELAVMVKQVASFDPAQLGEVAGIIDRIDYDLLKVDSRRFIEHILQLKQQIKAILGCGGDLPTPPDGHPSEEGMSAGILGCGEDLPTPPDGHPCLDAHNREVPSLSMHRSSEGILHTIQLLGHAHLDMAWLWEVAETWEAAERTFRSSLSLQQLFPDLTFCHSTPALYEWMEIHQPEIFAGICQQVRAGKWEIVGGMWIEPDLNVISGESIARQIIYGQAYNRSRFGAHTQVAWLPDTFGFCWQLPQLLQQGGIDYFVTQKFLWNDTTQFPHQLFWWEAPDGSRVMSLMSSAIGEGIDPLKMIDYACKWQTDTGINESLYLFGIGDHGGGPTRDMLELADRWSQSDVFPDLEFTTAIKYLDKLASRADSQLLPVWRDELYLEFHRGCFTTHADQKRSNRLSEDLLYQAELWSSIACIVSHQDYPADLKLQIETAWKQTLFNQFHDIIPGTAIEPVYITANEGWADVERAMTQIISNALGEICDRISLPTPPIEGAIPIVIFNALNWQRTEVVSLSLPPTEWGLEWWRVYDAAGRALEVVCSRQTQSSTGKILFLADLPSVGCELFWLVPYFMMGMDPIVDPKPRWKDLKILGSGDFIFKNRFVKVEIDFHTGDIASIWDEINQREVLTSIGANHLEAFQDEGQYWDAWNIDPKYAEKQLPPSQLKSIEWIEAGEIRQSVRVVRELAGCEFTQDYILDAHSPIVRIKTSVDWQAEHVLIKANFPLNLTADRSTAETACGAIDRTTTPETAAEKAKWELPMHRWVDLTDNSGEYGVSILNDSKYGFDAGTDYVRLTLLRSSKWPDPIADRGYHEFTYAIYPHSGTWQAAQTVRKGLELNSPLQVVRVEGEGERGRVGDEGTGRSLRTNHSFLDLHAENLVLMAFKPSEALDRSWVLRCYECHGVEGEIELSGELDLGIDRAINILEERLLDPVDTLVKPWQIKSFGVST